MARALLTRRHDATFLRPAPRRPICLSAPDLARLRCCEEGINSAQFLVAAKPSVSFADVSFHSYQQYRRRCTLTNRDSSATLGV